MIVPAQCMSVLAPVSCPPPILGTLSLTPLLARYTTWAAPPFPASCITDNPTPSVATCPTSVAWPLPPQLLMEQGHAGFHAAHHAGSSLLFCHVQQEQPKSPPTIFHSVDSPVQPPPSLHIQYGHPGSLLLHCLTSRSGNWEGSLSIKKSLRGGVARRTCGPHISPPEATSSPWAT